MQRKRGGNFKKRRNDFIEIFNNERIRGSEVPSRGLSALCAGGGGRRKVKYKVEEKGRAAASVWGERGRKKLCCPYCRHQREKKRIRGGKEGGGVRDCWNPGNPEFLPEEVYQGKKRKRGGGEPRTILDLGGGERGGPCWFCDLAHS